MLYIKTGPTGRLEAQWHIGEPVPQVQAHVVTFQADGEELELILRALEAKCYHSCPGHGFVHP